MMPHVLHDAFFTDYPAEAARTLETFAAAESLALLRKTSGRNVATLLSHMSPPVAAEILAAMPRDMARRTLPELTPNLAAGLLQRLEEDRRAALLKQLPVRAAEEIRAFMVYPPEAVGSLMDPRAFVLPEDLTVEEAIGQVRTRAPRDLYELYVIDRTQHLVGLISLRDLLLTDPDERLESVMRRDVSSIHPMENREEIVQLFAERKLLTIPVVDLDNRLLGVIRNQDIFQAGQEDATADLQTMVGASRDERALSPVWFSVRKRLPWLEVNLVTAFLAAFVVGLFEDTIARYTALAVLLPVVAGQSGNTGAQSLAVVMRGLALRDIRPAQWLRVGVKEFNVAFINALAVAATTGLAVYAWSHSGGLALVIMTSMVASMCIAGLAGAVIPVTLQAMKQDPAQSSSIVLTTVTDVSGFFSFLGLATAFSNLLE